MLPDTTKVVYWQTPYVTRYNHKCVHETQLINLIGCIHCPPELTSPTPLVRASNGRFQTCAENKTVSGGTSCSQCETACCRYLASRDG
jgi:hypothetical protein